MTTKYVITNPEAIPARRSAEAKAICDAAQSHNWAGHAIDTNMADATIEATPQHIMSAAVADVVLGGSSWGYIADSDRTHKHGHWPAFYAKAIAAFLAKFGIIAEVKS